MVSQDTLKQLVREDIGLSQAEKDDLLEKLDDDSFYDNLKQGALGAGLGYVVAKFMDLSRKARLLLCIAGFGIGSYLLDSRKKHDKFLEYNKQMKLYEIKQ